MEIEYSRLTDDEVCDRLQRFAVAEKECLIGVLECLIEMDSRRIHVKKSCPTLFAYCTKTLGYSESAAGKRIFAARKAKHYPSILNLLKDGRLHLEAVVMLGPHLNAENNSAVLEEACGKTKREIEWIVARLAPRPDARDLVRFSTDQFRPMVQLLENDSDPDSAIRAESSSDDSRIAPPAEPLHLRHDIRPTSPERVRFAFSGSERLLNLLRRAQDVLRHKYPAGEMENIFLEALDALLDRKDPERKLRAKEEKVAAGKEHAARPQSAWAFAMRHIPQAVKDAVWRRDGGRCIFHDEAGRRCEERGGLEYDHIVPFALGGPSNNPKNIRLLCRAHNLELARRTFGRAVPGRRLSGPGTSARPSC